MISKHITKLTMKTTYPYIKLTLNDGLIDFLALRDFISDILCMRHMCWALRGFATRTVEGSSGTGLGRGWTLTSFFILRLNLSELRIRNDLFRIRIRIFYFWIADPNPDPTRVFKLIIK